MVERISSVGLPGAATAGQLIKTNADFFRRCQAGQPAAIVRRVNNDGRLKFGQFRLSVHSSLAGRPVLLESQTFTGNRPGLAVWEIDNNDQIISLARTYLWKEGRLAEPVNTGGKMNEQPLGWADRFPPDWPRVGPLAENSLMLKIISFCRWGAREVFGRLLDRPESVFIPLPELRKILFTSGGRSFYHREVIADSLEDYAVEIRPTNLPGGRGIVSWLVNRQTKERFFPLMMIKLFDKESGRFLPWDQIKKEPYLFSPGELIPDSSNPLVRKLVWLTARGKVEEDEVRLDEVALAMVKLPGNYGKKVIYSLIDRDQEVATLTQKGGPRFKRMKGLGLQGISQPALVMLEKLTPELAARLSGGPADWLKGYRALIVWRLNRQGLRLYPWAIKAVSKNGRLLTDNDRPAWEADRLLGLPRALPMKQVPRMKALIFRLSQAGQELEATLAAPTPVVLRYGWPVRHLVLYELAGQKVQIEAAQPGRAFTLSYVRLDQDRAGTAVFAGEKPSREGFLGVWQLSESGRFLETPVQTAGIEEAAGFSALWERPRQEIPAQPKEAAETRPKKPGRPALAGRLDELLAEARTGLKDRPGREQAGLTLDHLRKKISRLKSEFGRTESLNDLAYITDKMAWHLIYPESAGGETLADWLGNSPLVGKYRQAFPDLNRLIAAVLKADRQ